MRDKIKEILFTIDKTKLPDGKTIISLVSEQLGKDPNDSKFQIEYYGALEEIARSALEKKFPGSGFIKE